MTLASILNQIFGILTIFSQALIALILIFLITKKPAFLSVIFKRGIFFVFIVALVAMIGSLLYSEVVGYEPCKLCWYQRIFMYSQVFLLLTALIKKDLKITAYSLVLSIIGAIIALYHYLLQIGIAPNLPCSAVGYSVSCSQRFILQFGYITLPMMSLTAFLLIAVIIIAGKRSFR